jgi:hypothetical protein
LQLGDGRLLDGQAEGVDGGVMHGLGLSATSPSCSAFVSATHAGQ